MSFQVLDTVQQRTDLLNQLQQQVNNIDQALVDVAQRTYTRPLTAPSTERPAASSVPAGTCLFDMTVRKPIWSDGQYWVDATGTYV